jgi:hypothetical protein
MIEQVPDAPYIREAERWGMPPYEDDPDYTEVKALLKEADKGIDSLVETLIEIDDKLKEAGDDEEFREQIEKLEDIGCDIRLLIMNLRG